MGGIQCVVPTNAVVWKKRIEKVKKAVTAETISNIESIPIITYEKSTNADDKIEILDLSKIRPTVHKTSFLSTDELHWMCAQWFGVHKCPGWNGFMEKITDSQDYKNTQIIFLPFLNLPPSSPDCINSVINFVVEKCKKVHQKCFVTFDQPT